MATRKPAKKRTATLRKAHDHVRAAKPRRRPQRKEVQDLLGTIGQPVIVNNITSEELARRRALSEHDVHIIGDTPVALGELRIGSEKLSAGFTDEAPVINIPDIDASARGAIPMMDVAACELIEAVEAYEQLVTQLTARLVGVLRPASGGVIARNPDQTGVPFVDVLNTQTHAIGKHNERLRRLLKDLTL